MKAIPHILFLARWYPDRYDPMMGLFIKRHAEVASGFANVAVLYLSAVSGKKYGFEIDSKIDQGVHTVIVYYGTKSIFPSAIKKIIAGFLFVIAFAKGYSFLRKSWSKPDLIHVNVLTRMGLIALWLRIAYGIKYVITEHWSRYLPITGTYKGFFRKLFTSIVIRKAEAVSTVSVNLAKAMQNHGLINRNYMVLPNVVDTNRYIFCSDHDKNVSKRFVHISCFEDRSKNISGIIRVLSKLAMFRNDFECLLVGEGIDLDKMKALTSDLALKEPQVQFTGLLEGENLISAYQQADFMVMFSNYENMPVVISESFSCGLPVVATAVGGIPEYVNKDNGILINAGDEAALLEAITYMLDHHNEFVKQNIRDKAVETFGVNAVAQKLQQLYKYVSY